LDSSDDFESSLDSSDDFESSLDSSDDFESIESLNFSEVSNLLGTNRPIFLLKLVRIITRKALYSFAEGYKFF